MMRTMIAMLVAALVPFAAQAAAPKMAPAAPAMAAPYYMTAKVGVYVPTADDMDLFNNGFASEVVVGRRLNPNFAVEGGLGWFQSSTDDIVGNQIKLSAIPIALNAKGILPLGKAEVYGLGGAALMVATMKTEGSLLGSQSDTETGFGLNLGAGAQYALSSQLSLGVEGRYLIAEVNDFGMNGFMFNGGLSFNF